MHRREQCLGKSCTSKPVPGNVFFFRVPPTPISSLLSSAALELPCTNQVLVSDSDNCSPSRFMSPSMDDESRLLASHCQ